MTTKGGYSTYTAVRALPNGECKRDKMIVYRDEDGLIQSFTGLELFGQPYNESGIKQLNGENSSFTLVYVCKALNWIVNTFGLNRLSEIKIGHVTAFFDHYREAPKDDDGELFRSQESLDKCVKEVSHFFANFCYCVPEMRLNPEDLLEKAFRKYRAQEGEAEIMKEVFIPVYHKKALHSPEQPLIRDIPPEVLFIILQQAEIHDLMIYYGSIYQITAGLRPSEVMNMRQPTSPVCKIPGIKISWAGNRIVAVEIDLTREYILRSDGVDVGGIKRERSVRLYPGLIQRFYNAYEQHIAFLKRHAKIEQDYQPMFVCRNGKAMTYDTYCRRFKNLIKKFVVPVLLASDDPALQAAGLTMQANPPAPHALRHYFTCYLVLEGLGPAEIQFYRGDRRPESAITYIQNKSVIQKELARIHDIVVGALRS